MWKLPAVGAVLFCVLVATGHAAGWPPLSSKPTGYFMLTQKGQPALVCAEWKQGKSSEVNCHILNVAPPSWPPAGIPPAHQWKTVQHGVKVACSQWNAGRGGRYIGLVARCDPVATKFMALWWNIPDGTAVKHHRV